MQIDLGELANWLKTSIPGIIVLGAVGSIVAVLLLAAARKILLEIISDRYVAVRVLLIRKRYVGAYALGHLAGQYEAGKKIEGYFVYFAWLTARLVVSVGGVILFAMLFLSVVDRGDPRLLTYGSYAAILAMFLCLINTVSIFRIVLGYYKHLIVPLFQKGQRTFDAAHWERQLRGEVVVGNVEDTEATQAKTNSGDGNTS